MDRPALSPLARSFERHLRAENRAANTVAGYLDTVRQAEAFLAARGRDLRSATRADLEDFLADLLARWSASTAATRHKGLRVLYRWLEEEDEVAGNPMARIKPPIVPEQPVPVVAEDSLRRLLAACAGKDFDARRDTAIVMLLVDAGPRVGELVGMRVADLDFDLEVAGVLGKGRRERALPFGRKTAVAIDRYLRVRARHRDGHAPWLWLGQRGPAHPLGRWADVAATRRAGRHPEPASASAPAHVLPRVAVTGRQRDRPDAPGRLEIPGHARPLRRQRRRRPRPRGPPPLVTDGPAVAMTSSLSGLSGSCSHAGRVGMASSWRPGE